MLVESEATLLMVDCGLTLKSTEARLSALGRHPRDVTALLVTHEHSDHIQGVARFAARYGTPVWMTPGTAVSGAVRKLTRINTFNCHGRLEIGSIDVRPFPVPHDAREPAQFVFEAHGKKLGVLTDTGHITSHIKSRLEHCDAIALECNHDLNTLYNSSYPEALKARVASSIGHLNNGQAAALLDEVGHPELQWVVALHLSEKNNTPELVHESLAGRLTRSEQVLHVATQNEPSDWIAID